MPTEPTIALKLRVRPGETIRAVHHNELVKLAASLVLQRGQLKGRQMPTGFMPRVQVSQTVQIDYPFRMQFGSDDNDNVTIIFTPGYIEGIMPKINDVALDDVDGDGNPPILTVTQDAWAPYGNVQRALVMLRYDLDKSFNVSAITPVAVPSPPSNPQQWFKLCGILTQVDGIVKPYQLMFFSQYFSAGAGVSTGHFTAFPRAGA